MEKPAPVREAKRLVRAFHSRVGAEQADASRTGAAVGAALLQIHPEARVSLVAGLVLLEEMAMLHYLQEQYTAQKQGREQRRNRKRLEEIFREVEEEDRLHVV